MLHPNLAYMCVLVSLSLCVCVYIYIYIYIMHSAAHVNSFTHARAYFLIHCRCVFIYTAEKNADSPFRSVVMLLSELNAYMQDPKSVCLTSRSDILRGSPMCTPASTIVCTCICVCMYACNKCKHT
jgi:hypothetical protein